MIHPEQAKLMFHPEYQYYVRAVVGHEDHGPLFIFGRRLLIEEYLAKELIGNPLLSMQTLVKRYYQQGALWKIPAYTYSVLERDGVFRFDTVVTAWPIKHSLYQGAQRVGWDLSDPAGPIDELEHVITEMKEAVRSIV